PAVLRRPSQRLWPPRPQIYLRSPWPAQRRAVSPPVSVRCQRSHQECPMLPSCARTCFVRRPRGLPLPLAEPRQLALWPPLPHVARSARARQLWPVIGPPSQPNLGRPPLFEQI